MCMCVARGVEVAELVPQGILVKERFLSPSTHPLSVSFISALPAVSHCPPAGPWRGGFGGRYHG